MKWILFFISFIWLCQSLHGEKDDIHISLETSDDMTVFFRRMLLRAYLEKLGIKNPMIKTDIHDFENNLQVKREKEIPFYPTIKDSSLRCNICLADIQVYELVLNHTLNPVKVQRVFIDICSIFKPYYRLRCIIYLRTTGFKVIKSILKNENPLKVCQSISACRRKEEISTTSDFSNG